MSINKYFGLAIAMALVISSLALPLTSSAQTRQENVQQRQEQRAETRQQIEENRDEAVEQRCDLVTTRIDVWVTRYQNNQDRHQRTYDKLREVSDQIVARAQAAGKDTSTFEAEVAELELLGGIARSEYDQLIQDLESTKSYACGESEGAFKEALQAARQQSLNTRQAILNARLQYQSEVRPAARALLES